MSGTQQKKGTQASAPKKKIEKHELKGAYIVPMESGDKMIQSLAELPIKYSQIIGPIIDGMQKAYRGDITVTVDPNKQPPQPNPAPEPMAKMKVKKDEE